MSKNVRLRRKEENLTFYQHKSPVISKSVSIACAYVILYSELIQTAIESHVARV